MKYIEATTISQPITSKKEPVIINAVGKRLVIRSNILLEDSDCTIIAEEVIIDKATIRLTATSTSLPQLYIVTNQDTNIVGADIYCAGDIRVNAGKNVSITPSYMECIRHHLPSAAQEFYANHDKPYTLEALGLSDHHEL